MRRLSARERVLVILGAVALVGFLVILGVVLPMANRASRLSHSERQLLDRIEVADRLSAKAPDLAKEIDALRANTAALLFARDNAKVALVHEIDQVASDVPVRVTSLRPPDEPESVAGLLKYAASFKVESDFSRLVSLLYSLEDEDRRLWVEGVEISATPGASDQLQTNVRVTVYVPAHGSEADNGEA